MNLKGNVSYVQPALCHHSMCRGAALTWSSEADCGVAVTQQVERFPCNRMIGGLIPGSLGLHVGSVLGQDTEPQIDAASSVYECV